MPLQPIVGSIDTISYECARYLSKVLSPLVGKTEHHVKNLNNVCERSHEIKHPDEELYSYDVSALFTSVSIDKSPKVIQVKLEEDNNLSERTPLELDNII